jgi:hypothetical protein
VTKTALAERQVWSATHEASHAVADHRLGVGRVERITVEGFNAEPVPGAKTGRTLTARYKSADPEAIRISELAGPAADPRHDLNAGRTAPLDVVRRFAAHDVPAGLNDPELRRYWLIALEFVEQHSAEIQRVAAALLRSPVERGRCVGLSSADDPAITHELDGNGFLAALGELS